MKKIVALVLSIVMICCFSVTAFAAKSPVATEKVTVTVRKADFAEGDIDKEITLDAGDTITVKADPKFGTFKSWSVYKTGKNAPATGMVTLSVLNLATSKTVKAVEGTDYEIVKGSLTSTEMTIKVLSSVVVCGNYDDKITDPNEQSNVDDSDKSDPTGDTSVYYIAIVLLAAAAFCFGIKKVYSK